MYKGLIMSVAYPNPDPVAGGPVKVLSAVVGFIFAQPWPS
jgi:hypothetical protein